MMMTVEQIIALLGGPTEVGKICGWSRNPGARGHDMKARKSIPVRYWPSIIAAARRKGIAGITHRTLTEAHVANKAAANDDAECAMRRVRHVRSCPSVDVAKHVSRKA